MRRPRNKHDRRVGTKPYRRGRFDFDSLQASLATALFKYLSVREPERFSLQGSEGRERFSDGWYLHVTDLYTACFRQIFYSRSTGTKVERLIPASLRMAFEMGKIVEERVKSWLKEMGVIHTENQVVKNEELGIVGSPDSRLLNGTIVDVKGMDPAVFRFTSRVPLPRHKFQIESYLWLDQDGQSGKLLSATWGTKEKVPFHDHDIHYNLKTGELIKRRVSELREAEVGGKLPGRVCKDKADPRAIVCPFREECFHPLSERAAVVQTIAEALK